MGTMGYMSPEQAQGQPVDRRSDIFFFGILLHETLNGRRPFSGDTDLEVLRRIVHGSPETLTKEAPPPLAVIVEKALEKDPARRYRSMREMVVDLRRLARQSGGNLRSRRVPRPVNR